MTDLEIPENLLDFYEPNGNPLKCPFCEGENIPEIITDMVESTVLEKKYVCTDCNTEVGYWAFGYFDFEFIEWVSSKLIFGPEFE